MMIEKVLKEYLDYLEIEKNRSRKTRENYERYLRAFINFSKIKKPEDITAEAVKNFRIWLARNPVRDRSSQDDRSHSASQRTASSGIKKITQTYYAIAIRNLLKYLVRNDYSALSPDKIELPKISRRQIDIIEYKDLERFLNSPNTSNLRGLRDKAILEVLFSTGLRISELCDLDRYLNLERGEITIRGKGEKLRVVFLSERAKAAIKNYLAKRTDPLEHLFISLSKQISDKKQLPRSLMTTGTPTRSLGAKVIGKITPRAVQRLVEFYRRKAGITKNITPHQIRHQFATDLLMNGADLRSVQELLGHSNISTTQIYTHITNKELKDIHKAFHGRRRE